MLTTVSILLRSLSYFLGTRFAQSSFRINTGMLYILSVDLSAVSVALVESQSITEYLIEHELKPTHSTIDISNSSASH